MENMDRVSGHYKMTVATTGRIDIVNVIDLVRIEAQSNYSKLFFADGRTLVVAKVLKKFEEQLDHCSFIRPHKTHLVNLQFVKSYEGKEHKSLVLKNGENIAVSRSKQRGVMKHLLSLRAV